MVYYCVWNSLYSTTETAQLTMTERSDSNYVRVQADNKVELSEFQNLGYR